MPELPEVQTLLADLIQEGIIGKTIHHVEVYWHKTVHQPDLKTFIAQLSGKKIANLSRRGKYLIFHFSDHTYLLVHLRMTGKLLLVKSDTAANAYVRLMLSLDHGYELRFHDTRKFGRWYYVDDPQVILHKMGPEPLNPDFTVSDFTNKLKQKSRALKPLLLDQSFMAGLGNIYVDEALWEAKLHPLQPAHSVTPKQAQALYAGIIHVLNRGIQSQGTTLGSGRTNFYRLAGQKGKHQTLLNVFRRTGEPCPRCGHLIARIVVAQRSTHFCPHCQKAEL